MHKQLRLRGLASHAAVAIALVTVGAGAIAVPGTAQAQTAAENYSIPAGSLVDALRAYSERTGLQMIYSTEIVEGRASPGVSGTMSSTEALARLLAGTGLTFRFNDDKTVLIEAAGAGGAQGERVLGAVRVQGAQDSGMPGATVTNGTNGSRDVTATEGTGSYTSNALTVGSKTAQSIKDTPMAVSVITNQQLQDQNITDLNAAMRDAPGVTVLHDNAGGGLSFYSRGFKITQMQIDGGAAQIFAPGGTASIFYSPVIDMSLYDHVEIVRGATGTFNAYGDPGGVLNLVRKRPLDHTQMLLEMQLGSWNWNRASADITGPLGLEGKLRGRLIATHQSNDYFYDIAKSDLNLLSATVELDATRSTLLTAGANYQEARDWGLPVGGLPRYATGTVIDFPHGRATCLCFPWATSDRKNLELFGQLEQRLGAAWTFKFKGTRILQRSQAEGAQIYGAADPLTGIGPRAQLLSRDSGHTKQTQFEATLDGSFRLFKQIQKIIVGANYSMIDPTGSYQSAGDPRRSSFFSSGIESNSQVGNVLTFDPYAWQPENLWGTYPYVGYEYADFRNLNAYISVNFTPLSKFHIITSLRYSQYRNRELLYFICSAAAVAATSGRCAGKAVGERLYTARGQLFKGSTFSWPPSVQVNYDLTPNLNAYAIYTDIYIDRSQLITKEGNPLPPTTGGNYEGGIKWLSPTKKLNATFSAYYIKQINVAADPNPYENRSTQNAGQLNQQISCCWLNQNGAYNLSYGADFEISGEVFKGFQISASYTYNINKANRPGYVNFDGTKQALQSQAPKHLAKIWTMYEFQGGSPLAGLRLGFGAQARSRTFVAGTYCPQTPVLMPWGPACPTDDAWVYFTDPGYVVFNANIGYKFSDKLRIDAEFENLLDKKYFEQVGTVDGGNWYGSPRSFKATLRGKF